MARENASGLRAIYPEPKPRKFARRIAHGIHRASTLFVPFPTPIPMRTAKRIKRLEDYIAFHEKAGQFFKDHRESLRNPETAAHILSEHHVKGYFGEDLFKVLKEISRHERNAKIFSKSAEVGMGIWAATAFKAAEHIAPEWVEPWVERAVSSAFGTRYEKINDRGVRHALFETAKFFHEGMREASRAQKRKEPFSYSDSKLDMHAAQARAVRVQLQRQRDWISRLHKNLARITENPALVRDEIRYAVSDEKLAGAEQKISELRRGGFLQYGGKSHITDHYYDDEDGSLSQAGQRLSVREVKIGGKRQVRVMIKNPIKTSWPKRLLEIALGRQKSEKREHIIFDPFHDEEATRHFLKRLGIKDAPAPKTLPALHKLLQNSGFVKTMQLEKTRARYATPNQGWVVNVETGLKASSSDGGEAELPHLVKISTKNPREGAWVAASWLELPLGNGEIYSHPNYRMGLQALGKLRQNRAGK